MQSELLNSQLDEDKYCSNVNGLFSNILADIQFQEKYQSIIKPVAQALDILQGEEQA